MATKRKTKAQREQEAKGALLQRIIDIYSGAAGDAMDDEDACATPENLSRVIPVVRALLGEPCRDWFGWRAHCLQHWETPGGAAAWLYDHGFRADEAWEPEVCDGE